MDGGSNCAMTKARQDWRRTAETERLCRVLKQRSFRACGNWGFPVVLAIPILTATAYP